MIDRKYVLALGVIGVIAFIGACNKSPFDRTTNASGGGALGSYGTVNGLVIFSDELKSGGGAFLYPGPENQSLSFTDRSNPVSARSIRYSWNGNTVSNPGCSPSPDIEFAGFDLMDTPTLAAYTSTPGRNLTAAGYNRVSFYVRGSLSTYTVLKVEVASKGPQTMCTAYVTPCVDFYTPGSTVIDDGSGTCDHAELSTSWQSKSIAVMPSQMSSVKDFFKATLVYNAPYPASLTPGQGGTVYFDQIVYTH